MSSSAPIGFTLIGGYLGAGKTTLLNHLLTNNQSMRIAVLINDFGAINIDAALIEHRSDSQINLTNGCVCCGLSDGFDRAIEQLLDSPKKPDHIVVEASGVADIATLSQYGQAPELNLDGVLVVADAETVRTKAVDKYVANTVTRQLAAADLLVLNKIDLVGPAEEVALKNWLSQYVSSEHIVPTTFSNVPLALLIGARTPAKPPLVAARSADKHAHQQDYLSWNFQWNAPLSPAQVNRFLRALPPTILRGKGFFDINQPVGREQTLWQRVGARESLTPMSLRSPKHTGESSTTQIVVIAMSAQVSKNELDELANTYLRTA